MSTRVSDDELERLMAAMVDEHGVDRGVEAATAAMSAEQRQQSEENLRRLIERMRRSARRPNG